MYLKILNGFKVNSVRYMIKGRLGNFKIIDRKSQFNYGKLENLFRILVCKITKVLSNYERSVFKLIFLSKLSLG
ncbi:hypothetical protein GLOIN_2v1727727 [Rhizophagus irregularis DAOM 181602=DAOM 197198]|uniref:Uncharacterized protein n=1 Tax=Rhizophagus irregularis (strain DAOM 181602 / DAOM 197198 / MUCL 43194) TaxID=747089 RepID=A0A2P4P071_RHIID|nr:hypothetical protein GLOIN_2v1727727 [Rhizophagus irregularis DAOM 181602=DAOM 197198]POG58768.1 hypothetical protein GLOIN_2v1727727 [Rhizophagus irregularis DAOM 181602=DAOM 197198]|eukprot:XP_025165634.1 hypothetical protein GLOIN_2v1727727 [Rhizophagus irregularis DAOM 181602=DAOM 197198]